MSEPLEDSNHTHYTLRLSETPPSLCTSMGQITEKQENFRISDAKENKSRLSGQGFCQVKFLNPPPISESPRSFSSEQMSVDLWVAWKVYFTQHCGDLWYRLKLREQQSTVWEGDGGVQTLHLPSLGPLNLYPGQ